LGTCRNLFVKGIRIPFFGVGGLMTYASRTTNAIVRKIEELAK
jgi:hypothetical protein